MRTIAIHNAKGGVGKTTTAVNLAYLAADAGPRVLLWDLDPQAASTFAFRIQPHVAGFGKRSLENGDALRDAIKQTDYDNLYLLPADFAYHKLDRLLGSLGDPGRLLHSLLATIGRDFDIVFLDCPAGFSRLTEAILSSADTILAPTIPTVLSLRMLAQLVEQAERSRSRSSLAAVFNMVDRRKTLHRRACELATVHGEIFLSAQIPYASVVEQMATRRMPTAAFAADAPAARAFAEVWAELQTRRARAGEHREERRWTHILREIESLIARLESTERPISGPGITSASDEPLRAEAAGEVVHRFDTDERDLERLGHALELRERAGGEFIVVARVGAGGTTPDAGSAEARIDRSWTVQILAGEISPLDALERRSGSPPPPALEQIRAATNGRRLRRVDTCQRKDAGVEETAPERASAPAPIRFPTVVARRDESSEMVSVDTLA
jgi:cellulose biosynthesis protein BcsQ